jgi:hydroxymethylpyrimidine/phosphomethylpyrimidine kinase
LQSATTEALTYLDHSLNAGYQPGMGHLVPDRMFWAQTDDDADDTDDASSTPDPLTSTPSFDIPPNGTKH